MKLTVNFARTTCYYYDYFYLELGKDPNNALVCVEAEQLGDHAQ
jgi:hypothetical protein